MNLLQTFAQSDYRHPRYHAHFQQLLDSLRPSEVLLSVGGGPARQHPRMVNLNIEALPNVELVGDAHQLPCRDSSIGAIYCEAVLEHLEDPGLAAREMLRVLKPGGFVLASTPFLQAFHGYPNHYQNFTAEGHRLLFQTAGFEVVDHGPCVGPLYTLTSLISTLLAYFLPRPIGLVARATWWPISRILRIGDRWLVRHPNAHVLASSTFVLARKPVAV